MKKTKALRIQFQSWDNFKEKMTKDFKEQKSSKIKNDNIVFSSVNEYQKFMIEQKLSILAAIANKSPTSIYQLAKLLDRDFANVQRDCVALANHGFMKFDDSEDSRNSKISL
jgi:predicted transcriptional regulator